MPQIIKRVTSDKYFAGSGLVSYLKFVLLEGCGRDTSAKVRDIKKTHLLRSAFSSYIISKGWTKRIRDTLFKLFGAFPALSFLTYPSELVYFYRH